jgi:hypothetical protein
MRRGGAHIFPKDSLNTNSPAGTLYQTFLRAAMKG